MIESVTSSPTLGYMISDRLARELAEQSALQALRLFASHDERAVERDVDGVLLVASAARFPGAYHAAGIRVRRDVPADHLLAAVRAFAVQTQRDMTIWAAEDLDTDVIELAEKAGLSQGSSTVGMVSSSAPDDRREPAGVRVEAVVDEVGVEAFAAVHRRSYQARGFPVDAVGHYASGAVLLAPETDAAICYVDGRPVATAMSVTGPQVAGVYWVLTDAAYRRRGLADLVTRFVVRAAFKRGVRQVTLQATDLGAPVYSRLEFAAFTTYRRYLLPAAHPASPSPT